MDLGSAPSESVKFQEYLHGLVLGHSELVIDAGGILGTVLRPLPELARVISRERNDVLLGKMAEDGVALLHDLVRAVFSP